MAGCIKDTSFVTPEDHPQPVAIFSCLSSYVPFVPWLCVSAAQLSNSQQ